MAEMRLGLLTSGGDAPGMNAVVHAFAVEAGARGDAAIGVRGGFGGLVDGATVDLADEAFGAVIVGRGGTVLGTSRAPDLRSAEAVEAVKAGLRALALDGLAVAGGSGTRAGVERLRDATRLPIVFVPATIDGDVAGSEGSIGFDSAVEHGVRALDDLLASAVSLPGRAFLVEVLGADCGRIAEAMAAAAPVDAVLVPERPPELEAVAAAMSSALERRHAIALMTEGCGEAGEMARRLGALMGTRVRQTVLGHGQRGTSPTARDRTLGLEAGHLAAAALSERRGGDVRIVAGSARFEPIG
jgi:6-phosphofructokinase 1